MTISRIRGAPWARAAAALAGSAEPQSGGPATWMRGTCSYQADAGVLIDLAPADRCPGQ
jgi:hypothetical protein